MTFLRILLFALVCSTGANAQESASGADASSQDAGSAPSPASTVTGKPSLVDALSEESGGGKRSVTIEGVTLTLEIPEGSAFKSGEGASGSAQEGPQEKAQPEEPAAFSIAEYSVSAEQLYAFGLLALSIFAGLVAGRLIKLALVRISARWREQEREIRAILVDALGRGAVFIFAIIGLDIGLNFIEMSPGVREFADTAISILVIIAVATVLFFMVDIPHKWLLRKAEQSESKLDDMIVPLIRTSLRVAIVVLALTQVAQTLSDKPITSIIASLGIGGIAIAFAAQDTIRNFFGSVMIFADRPFDVGDRVVVDGHDGPVEHVGLRSTRIRTLEGHLVTVPNGELANKTIHNIGKRPYIRKIMNVTITYDTPPEKVERAVEILREIFDQHEGMDENFPPRVYFNDFNADSLNIIVIFWYHPPAYWDFLDFCERVNLEIFRRYNAEGIDFAFPTQTLFLAGDPNRPLNVGVTRGGEEEADSRPAKTASGKPGTLPDQDPDTPGAESEGDSTGGSGGA